MELNPFAYKIAYDGSDKLSVASEARTNHVNWINDRLNLMLEQEKLNKIEYGEDGILIAIEDVDFDNYYSLKWMKRSDIHKSFYEEDTESILSKIANEKPIIAFISKYYYMVYQIDFEQITKYITLQQLQ